MKKTHTKCARNSKSKCHLVWFKGARKYTLYMKHNIYMASACQEKTTHR